MNKVRLISVFAVLAMLFSFANVSPVAAEETPPPDPAGWTQGSGIHFELPDSPYLPVTLDSSAPVTLTLSSVPKVVDLMISANPVIGSAEFTLSGFAANTLYYRYEDEGLDPVSFTTDADGSFTFSQDLSESHHVWFRETPSTYFLYDNATGGDCTSFGTWDWGTKTCTMTQDVYQTIFIQANGITLDGDGFSSLYSDNYYAVYSYGNSDVTIKNLNVSGSSYGFYVVYGNNNTVANNTVLSYYGFVSISTENLTVTNNSFSSDYYGIYIHSSNNFSVTENMINNAYYYGIYLWNADNGTIRGNTILDSYFAGVYIDGYTQAEDYWYNGYNYVNSYDSSSTNNTVYQNNFLNGYGSSYYGEIYIADWASPAVTYYFNYGGGYYGWYSEDTTTNVGNVFNLSAPDGGNYYSIFDESLEGCNDANSDSFCDSAFGSGSAVDNLPWTVQDGWANQAPTADAGGPYLVAVNSSIDELDGSGSTDPDDDTLTETWTAVGGGTIAGNTFTAGSEAGIFDVCLTVSDDTVDSAEACTIMVVYDPSGGFVTGGGWIDSPAGAYMDDESLSGKATFGFVSKYKKGANVPTGNTEFQFHAAGFNFHSGTYEWLVVNQGGANAQFKGDGTINGALDLNGNAYKFMLWAGDGSPDTFRIRIWSELDGIETVVYDNDVDQEIGGGSIVIHTKK